MFGMNMLTKPVVMTAMMLTSNTRFRPKLSQHQPSIKAPNIHPTKNVDVTSSINHSLLQSTS